MVAVDSGPEQGAIYDAIVQVSNDAKVDARLILAVIMQEVCIPPIPLLLHLAFRILTPNHSVVR